ncbi:hypothetical protein, partial [Salinibacter ruber]|uniref:hypothetical protein n=1 Tax=Salinibacter ruber TaxID=146919 RepID=UPI0021674ACD
PPDVLLAVVVWSSLSGRAVAFGHIGADGLVSPVSSSMSWNERMPDIVPKVNYLPQISSVEGTSVSLYRE